jgi:hypothetical protein
MSNFTGALEQFANAGAGLTKNAGALGQYSSTLGGVGNAAGIATGIDKGGVSGYGSAAVNAGNLAGKLGLIDKNSALNSGVGDAANVLGVYNGIKQGGVGGYGGAAVNAAQLGSKAGAFGSYSGALGSAAGYAAIPLALYNEINSWQSGATGSDALAGASTGAAIGSVVPGIGTAIGALVGGAAGALSSAFGNGKVAPENANWVGYTDAWNKTADAGKQAGATPEQIADAEKGLTGQVTNPYGALAGYFDLRNNQVKGNNPLYSQYGRMGEQKFTNDLVGQINDATKAGKIGPNDDASAIYNKVVQPWESSWGKGDSTDQNKDAMQGLITQMISQYEGGTASDNWLGRSGDKAFGNLGKPPTAGTPQNPYGPSTQMAQNDAIAAEHDRQRAAMGIAPAGAQPAPVPTPIAQVTQPQVGIQNMRGPVMARGGALSRVKRKRFGDGGDTGDYDFSDQPSFNPGSTIDFNSLYNGGSGNDNTDFSSNLNDIQGQLDQSKFTNDQLGTWLDSYESNNPAAKPGALSQLAKNATGGAGLAGLLKAYTPLIPLVSGAINSKNTKAPTTASGMTTSAIKSLPTAHFNRTQNMAPTNSASGSPMTQQDWYTYGSRPEASFYQNNGIPLNQTVTGQAKGGTTPEHSKHPGALGQATGVPEFNSAQESYVPDQGPGDGQSDDVPARLSKGEFVFDAHSVSMLGNGSNSTGAAKLEKLRQNLRKHAAQSNSKGKQFMKAKEPEQYMNQGHSKVKGKGKPVAFAE